MTNLPLDIPDAIDEIYDRVETLFANDEALVRGWFNTPNPGLHKSMTPNEMLKGKRVRELLGYVQQLTTVPETAQPAETFSVTQRIEIPVEPAAATVGEASIPVEALAELPKESCPS